MPRTQAGNAEFRMKNPRNQWLKYFVPLCGQFAFLCAIRVFVVNPGFAFRTSWFSFFSIRNPHFAIRNPLVACVPAKWLSAGKNIYERTHLWQKPDFAELLVN
jgi:hypothetical protein